MQKAPQYLAFLLLAPMIPFAGGCDRMIDDITSGEPPPCVITKGAECEPPPPPPPPITFGS